MPLELKGAESSNMHIALKWIIEAFKALKDLGFGMEIFQKFTDEISYREWFQKQNINTDQIDLIVDRIMNAGIDSLFFGKIRPDEISKTGNNLRENFKAKNLNSRKRALLEILLNENNIFLGRSPKIYAAEAITQLALELRHRYPYFVGSEYIPDPVDQKTKYPIQHQNLLNLTFENDTFDAVITSDVLEHVPDINKALVEMARVLKQGGVMLATHPFTWQQASYVKAILSKGKINYLTEPEYHGNPIDPGAGSLVFSVPGFEIINWCMDAGFSEAEMIILASEKMGVLGSNPPFINVLRARK
jgi:SAM-dependent methyltransferase